MTAVDDRQEAFLHLPWAAALLSRPNITYGQPTCRVPKADGEDSLFAEAFRSAQGIQSLLYVHDLPPSDSSGAEDDDRPISEVAVLAILGDKLNGHPKILHGGVTATLIDESMGILQTVNTLRKQQRALDRARAKGGSREREGAEREGMSTFTVELKIRYLRPIVTPGALLIRVRSTKKEGRKEWLLAEVKQFTERGEEVVCATGEALFVEPKKQSNKL